MSALNRVPTALGDVSYRRSASPFSARVPLVLLHGIGCASSSWAEQLTALAPICDVLAWDAPGYGDSAPLNEDRPSAQTYGARVWAWLDALNIVRPIHLVGQSLGCIMAAAAARQARHRVERLTLISPALGYGDAGEAVREQKRNERIANVTALGMTGIARKRASAMLRPDAPAALVARVQAGMAEVPALGYVQAAHCLADSDLRTLCASLDCPIAVAGGRSDTVTPYAQSKAFAQSIHASFVTLGDAGHLAACDEPTLVNALLGN